MVAGGWLRCMDELEDKLGPLRRHLKCVKDHDYRSFFKEFPLHELADALGVTLEWASKRMQVIGMLVPPTEG